VVALYDAGIHWMDSQVARLVGALRDLGVWDGCLLTLTADHGEEFLDHGGRYHPPSKVTEELIRVPLLLHGTGVSRPATIGEPFSLLHLAPTLLDLMEIPIPGSFRGSSYLPALRDGKSVNADAVVECVSDCSNPFVVENRLRPRLLAVRESRYKLVLDFNSPMREQLFDLEADPGERHPLAANSNDESEKMVRRRLLERARQHLNESISSRDSAHRLAARLRDVRLEWAAGLDLPGDKASA
jgi:arylsulfatase A-like enzyme